MNRIFIIITLFLTFSCNSNFDHTRVYDIIQGKFPHDSFIEKTIKKAKEPKEPLIFPEFSVFDPQYDPLDFLLEKPFLELHHIYEIQWADKLIAERVKGRRIYKHPQ